MEISKEIIKLVDTIKNNRITFKQIKESEIQKEVLKNQVTELKKDIKLLKLNNIKINNLLKQFKELEEKNKDLKLDLKKSTDAFKFIITTQNEASETVSSEIGIELLRAKEEVLICSPWITHLVDELSNFKKKANERKINLKIITRLNKEDINKGITDLEKFRVLKNDFGAEIRYNNNLHAKMIIIDNLTAIISSANLTKKGLSVNYEAGVSVKDKNMVKKSSQFFNEVWKESEPLTEQSIKKVLSGVGD